MVLEGSDELQIDVGYGSKPEQKISTGSASEGHSAMTWLQAAEYVLREEGGPGMHIRELTRTILELGMVRRVCDRRSVIIILVITHISVYHRLMYI